jgi:lipopolysaccharide transport system permease protein
MMLVFTVVLGRFAADSTGAVPYPLYVFAGLLSWNFFSSAVGNSANSVVASESLITKVYFPRLIIPLAAALAATVDFVVSVVAFIPLMLCYGFPPTWSVVLLPAIAVVLFVAALGPGTLLAGLNVTYRDFRFLVPFFLQLGMFATPAIYLPAAPTVGGEGAGWGARLLSLNPMAGIVQSFRAALLGQPIPWGELGYATVVSAVVFVIALFVFRRFEDSFADTI